ncbi:MAG TPA: molybdenum cofactor guanylyltransferase [Oculatellaceae cyanobacterium]
MANNSSSVIIDSVTREALPLPMTAVILCGGKSRRMGRPKAFLPYKNSTMIEHILSTVRDLFQEVLLVANEPETFESFDVNVVKDILPYRGPLGGILSGLLVSGFSHTFVIACDMPLVNKRLIRDMASRRHGNDVVVLSHKRGVEPLLGVYSKNCIKQLEETLFSGNLSMQDFLSGLKAQAYFHDFDEQQAESLPPFFNVNTPQDYSHLITGVGPSVTPFTARRSNQTAAVPGV